MKLRIARVALAAAASLALSHAAAADDLVIYPAKGQAADQQKKDEGECQAWAKQNTGIDPAALAAQAAQPAPVAAPPPPPEAPGRERARGAARGAAVGAAVGAIAGDAGEGAAAGAVVGTAAGGREKRQGRREAAAAQQQAEQQAKAQADAAAAETQQKLATWNKAYAACLEGRGYTVK